MCCWRISTFKRAATRRPVGFERLIEEDRTWDNLARLAYWKSKLGEVAEADQLYEEAEQSLTAKQMRSYAWLKLQRGVLAITHGRYADAWTHYRRADEAYPCHWHTDEHFAELLAAKGRSAEVEAPVSKRSSRAPTAGGATGLGELYLFTGGLKRPSLRSTAPYPRFWNQCGVAESTTFTILRFLR